MNFKNRLRLGPKRRGRWIKKRNAMLNSIFKALESGEFQPRYAGGVDLGSGKDYTAVMVFQKKFIEVTRTK